MNEIQLRQATAMNNLKPLDFPFDEKRLRRAEQFAGDIMAVVAPYIQRQPEARNALVAAAYAVDAQIVRGSATHPRHTASSAPAGSSE